MRVKLLLATLVVAATPGLAMAYCSGTKHDQTAMSCPEGQSYDAATQTCKATPTG